MTKEEERLANPAADFMRTLLDGNRCKVHVDYRKVRWFCSLEKGHEGDHCRVDMDLRYFKEKPTFRMSRTAAIPVKDLKP